MFSQKTTLVAAVLILLGIVSIVMGTISYAGGLEEFKNPLDLGPDSTLTSVGAGFLAGLGCLAFGLALSAKPEKRGD